jgi:small-conductance mechanosensitive channel
LLSLRLQPSRLLLVLALVVFAVAARADQASITIDKANKTLDRARVTLDEVEKSLGEPNSNEQILRQLRERVAALPVDLQDVIDRLTPRLQAVDARLKELGTPSGDAKPAAPDAAGSLTPPAPAPAPAPIPASAPPKAAAPAAPAPAAKAPASPGTKAPPPAASPKAPGASSKSPEPDAVPEAKPKMPDTTPAASDSASLGVNAEWADQRKLYDDIDSTLKRARALLVESRQVLVTVVARQRALFAKTLFLRTNGLFSPTLWKEAAAEAPRVVVSSKVYFEERGNNVGSRLSDGGRAEFIGLALLILIAIPPLLLLARRVLARSEEGARPTKTQRAAAAAWTALVTITVPLVATLALGALIDSYDLVDASLEPLQQRIIEAVARVAVAYGIARALMAPDYPHWRLVDPGDPLAGRLTRLSAGVAMVLSVARLLEQIEETVQSGLAVVIVTRGMGVLICVALTVATLSTFQGAAADKRAAGRDWLLLTQVFGYAVVAVAVGACAAGYVTFANFFVLQICWSLVVAGLLYIALKLMRAGIDRAFAPTGLVGRAASNTLGVERQSLGPFAELLAGVMTLALFGVAVLLVLAPFGVESGDFLSNLQSSFVALKIGDVTISPSSALSSLALFGVTLAAAHGLQRWLDGRFLPLTRLDMGLRNSIGTSVGYAGFIVAASVALSHLGLGFEKLAIVAGALSVGIGFGLQSIVNNFVSGLILLWERAVRVGDWVVIGDEQGYVKRINVRSTEIETFDRATMIVPNSNLVTGVVKNWLRGDKVGRIKIALAPNSRVDPEQIRDILLAAARAQDGVLRIPAPQVMFLAMESNIFRFELWCYVEDVEQATRLKSDLHFDLYKRLADAGVTISPAPTPPTVVQFPGLDKFAAAAAGIVVDQKLLDDEVAKVIDPNSKAGEAPAQ